MNLSPPNGASWFRLWIVRCDEDWQPASWNAVPARATAVKPVADDLYSAGDAALWLKGFNSEAAGKSPLVWAVAVPVTLRMEGDATAGQTVQGFVFPADVSAEIDRAHPALTRG